MPSCPGLVWQPAIGCRRGPTLTPRDSLRSFPFGGTFASLRLPPLSSLRQGHGGQALFVGATKARGDLGRQGQRGLAAAVGEVDVEAPAGGGIDQALSAVWPFDEAEVRFQVILQADAFIALHPV